ncbi:cyclic nucleotide-binding/CBS domain-containing protein [Saccharopolyspora sp. MS10]|uniref:CBS domain-containing protein n=1 Tax=Saccharopolyspora sp. MS10 TaxID=3385973 RepID=UPI00399F73CA
MSTDRSANQDLPRARELASGPVITVRGELDAVDALREMYRRGVHHLAVLPEDPLGLVTAADLLFGIAARRPGERVPVAELCRRPAPGVGVDDTGAVAAARLVESGSDAAFVWDAGAIRGVVTASDFVRAVAGAP